MKISEGAQQAQQAQQGMAALQGMASTMKDVVPAAVAGARQRAVCRVHADRWAMLSGQCAGSAIELAGAMQEASAVEIGSLAEPVSAATVRLRMAGCIMADLVAESGYYTSPNYANVAVQTYGTPRRL
jgi:hypothetical protein